MPAKTTTKIWSDEEKAAMAQSAKERKAQAKLTPEQAREAGEQEILAKIAELPAGEREIATRVHEIMSAAAPNLVPRTYYGMPAYATEGKDGKVICFFQSAAKFKSRYATFGFNDSANLDKGAMWPTAFALEKLTAAEEKKIGALVKKAAS